jgi:hypothetical protein
MPGTEDQIMKAEKRRVKTHYKMRIVCFFINIVFKNQDAKTPKKNQEPRCQRSINVQDPKKNQYSNLKAF